MSNVFIFIARRVLIMPITLLTIITVNFLIIQVAPGGPVDRVILQIKQANKSGNESQSASISAQGADRSLQKAHEEIDKELLEEIKKSFGFDVPLWKRYINTVTNYLRFDFGRSYYQDTAVTELIIQRLPVSASLGLLSTVIIYIFGVWLGIQKAVKVGSKFDIHSGFILSILYSMPSFMIAIILITLFCGGNFFALFPISGLFSDNFEEMTFAQKVLDCLHHLALPLFSVCIGGIASIVTFSKNSFLEEFSKHYILTLKAKHLPNKYILYKHIFKNALILIISSLPSALVASVLSGFFIIENIFSLNGIGQLSFQATVSRDYPVMFGSLYIFTLIYLILTLLSDLLYQYLDPRVSYSAI